MFPQIRQDDSVWVSEVTKDVKHGGNTPNSVVGRSEDTIRRLIRKDAIKGVRLPSSTHFAILPSEVLRLSREHDIPITDADRKMLEEYQAAEPQGIG